MTTNLGQKKEKTEKSKRGRKPGKIIFPRNSLNETLRVPQLIWENNAGQPLPLLDIAVQLDKSPTSRGFMELIRSSQRYGLTNESFTQDLTKTISLTSLGNSIVAPTPDDDVNALKLKALENPDLFREVLSIFDGKIIPQSEPFKNMLIRNHNLTKPEADSCFVTISKNINELGIYENLKGKMYLKLSGVINKPNPLNEAKPVIDDEPGLAEPEEMDAEEEKSPPCLPVSAPKVFISHSKNKKIVDQIKQILDFGQFEYTIAVETETTAIPIPDKIFGLMRECNCSIINISADEKEKRQDGSYGINPNVLIEIGGAFLNYDKKVILLVDKRIELPSNLQGLYRCEYEGDELSFTTAMKLQKALTDFRKLNSS